MESGLTAPPEQISFRYGGPVLIEQAGEVHENAECVEPTVFGVGVNSALQCDGVGVNSAPQCLAWRTGRTGSLGFV